eukprot:COSAG03_NODE_17132_length_383_cov_1.095070_1_plen_30_part_10
MPWAAVASHIMISHVYMELNPRDVLATCKR